MSADQTSKQEIKPKFQPGKFKVHTDVTGFKNPEGVGRFGHNSHTVERLVSVLTDVLHEVHMDHNHDPTDKPDFQVLVQRMSSLYMAKQLSTAVGPTHMQLTQMNVGVVAAEMKFPTALVPLLGGYGFIEDKEGDWEMNGQALWSTTYMGRALCVGNPVVAGHVQGWNRGSMFTNMAHFGWRMEVTEYYSGLVRAWAKDGGFEMVNIGGAPVSMSAPIFDQGAAVYRVFVQPWNPPPNVLAALRVIEVIEGLNGAAVVLGAVQAFNAEGLVLVDWGREEIAGLVSAYRAGVEARLLRNMMSVWHVETVKSTAKTGSMWQLNVRHGQEMMGPKILTGEGEQIGWMMVDQANVVEPSVKGWVVRSGTSHVDKMRSVVHSFTKY